MHGAAMWASCKRAPTTRFLDEGTTPTTTSTKFHATRCYRSWAMRRRRDAWQMPKQWNYWYGMYTWYIHITAWHMIYHIYLSIHLSIYLSISIHPSIHLPTYILLILLQGGFLFDDWFSFCILLFLFGDIYWGGIQLLAYYCLLLSDMGSWGW